MKTSLLLENVRMNQGEVIAGWGQARLIRHLDGRYQLAGGTAEDQAVVREWISLFAHNIVFTTDRQPLSASRRRENIPATCPPS